MMALHHRRRRRRWPVVAAAATACLPTATGAAAVFNSATNATTPQVTLITFLDCGSVAKFALALRNKACYARRQGYRYEVKMLPSAKDITYRKPFVMLDALRRAPRESLVVWTDADLIIMRSNRTFLEFVDLQAADLWMTDHNCNPNNGAIAVRVNDFGFQFLKDWAEVCQLGQFPFTDQGAFYETLLRRAGGVSLIDTCDLLKTTQKVEPLMSCVMREWDAIFGAFDGATDRVAGRIGLRRAADGYNNHLCNDKHRHQYCRRVGGWAPSVCFRNGMFALHGRSPERSKALNVPAANYDSASLVDVSLRRCVRRRKGGGKDDVDDVVKPLREACAAISSSKQVAEPTTTDDASWVNVGAPALF
mmetsp:Transcript_18458/g.56664  ORF Transcript_18458/g.56664 Transcript_18458/m.56664 type:complete len:363 (+) Transcript_18458:44-1132(+)